MADEQKRGEALMALEVAVEQIVSLHGGGRFEEHTMDDGLLIVSIETDDKAVRAEGYSRLEAFSHLMRNAKDEGWA